jgi:hypothetical protein
MEQLQIRRTDPGDRGKASRSGVPVRVARRKQPVVEFGFGPEGGDLPFPELGLDELTADPVDLMGSESGRIQNLGQEPEESTVLFGRTLNLQVDHLGVGRDTQCAAPAVDLAEERRPIEPVGPREERLGGDLRESLPARGIEPMSGRAEVARREPPAALRGRLDDQSGSAREFVEGDPSGVWAFRHDPDLRGARR